MVIELRKYARVLLPATVLTAMACAMPLTSHAATAKTTRSTKAARAAEVAMVQNGISRSVIVVDAAVMADDKTIPPTAADAETQAEDQRRRLRESVKDLAYYFQKISGAPVAVVTTEPAASDKRLPILIGQAAVQKFGPVTLKAPYAQGFRVVVTPQAIGLFGESDESSSYAIYEVLQRLGCRWYMQSEMGEEIPHMKTIALPVMDYAGAPGTWYRGIWYSDPAFRRRNRMGGFGISAGHALEHYVTDEQRKEHPEWRAIINGQPNALRLKWSNPGVQQAVADAIIAQLDKHYVPSISLSPEDGGDFDQSDDTKWDAGDYDPVMNSPSITDRYIKFCNIVAEKVTKKYPDVKLGFLAYVQYTQPPVREKLHPNLVPLLAPINYCRAHAMTDNCPSRAEVKKIVEGWAKASNAIAYYNYMFNLAEYSAPYPMIHQMKEELPILYANHIKYWEPEGIPNNDSILPGNYLTIRKAWNPQEDSDAILNEFFTRFYGAAEKPMRKYWTMFDDQWINVDEHAGGGWDYMRRFTPEFMKQARATMNEALAACQTAMEYRRVKMEDLALTQFERFMQLHWDLHQGRLADLGPDSEKWVYTELHLADEYQKQYAFGKSWSPSAPTVWFRGWIQLAYLDATRLAKTNQFILPPISEWKYLIDKEKTGEAQGLFNASFDDAAWKMTRPGIDTWAALGIPNYFGPVWYRTKLRGPATPAGKKVYLWVSREDGNVKLWVNGQHIPYVYDKGQTQDEFQNGYGTPISFDVTSVLKPGVDNQITIRGTRVFINELGTGGLMGPVYLYAEK
jgi:hypothetical protein